MANTTLDSKPTRQPAKEPHSQDASSRLNWLRASVLGANDGIVSIAGLVVGVAGATTSRPVILTAGIAGLVAGALSMAVGEYVSVSSQRDSEQALLEKERTELKQDPSGELAELTQLYQARGLSPKTAAVVAKELTRHDVFAAHVDIELGIDPNNLTNPWQAAAASAASFTIGGLIPMIAIFNPVNATRVPLTFAAVLIALALTGGVSGWLSRASISRATIRVVAGGALAMLITYGIGRLFHISGL